MDKITFENRRIPLHYQIADYLIVMLKRGDIKADEKLPTEENLRDIFSVSRTTIRKSLDHLYNKGLLHKIQGKGTYWNEAILKFTKEEKLSGINEEIFNISDKTRVHVLSKRIIKSDNLISQFLNLQLNTDVIEFKRLRFIDDVPMSLTFNYLPDSIGSKIEKDHLTKMTMLQTLETQIKIELGIIEHDVEITRANKEIADYLNISVLDPVLTVNTRVFNLNREPIEIVWTHFKEDSYKFKVVFNK